MSVSAVVEIVGTVVAWWVLICYLTAVMSGWFILGRRFQFQGGTFQGAKWRFRSGRMRFYTRYGTCLTAGADVTGLYLAVFPILRIGHPPLLVPWSEVTVTPGTKGIIYRGVELRLGRGDQIPLRISAALVDRLRRAAGASWPAESAAV